MSKFELLLKKLLLLIGFELSLKYLNKSLMSYYSNYDLKSFGLPVEYFAFL